MPEQEYIMDNFMHASQMIFGCRGWYCITYKHGTNSFDIYGRRFEHEFRVKTCKGIDLEACVGLPIESLNAFLVGKGDKIMFYDLQEYQEMLEHRIDLQIDNDPIKREPVEILSMAISQDN